jgi:hypothetical protein
MTLIRQQLSLTLATKHLKQGVRNRQKRGECKREQNQNIGFEDTRYNFLAIAALGTALRVAVNEVNCSYRLGPSSEADGEGLGSHVTKCFPIG